MWVQSVFPEPKQGSMFTAVIEVTMSGDDSQGSLVGYSRSVIVKNRELPLGRHTIYHASVTSCDPLVLEVIASTKIVVIPEPLPEGLPGTKECCAGMGGIGRASMFLGSPVRAALDFSSLACGHLRRNFSFPVLCGSVTDDEMLFLFQTASSPEPCIHTVGFPCQPFSRQGDRRGLSDSRVQALWGSLRSMYLCQAVAGVLECVVGAGRHEELQRCLAEFCARMGWVIKSVEIDLAARWPCSRLRWWALLVPCDLGVDLTPWPCDDRFTTIAHAIPSWPYWDVHEESLLQFTDEEIRYFDDPVYGSESRLLVLNSKCPTFLHSYGHGLLDCPCQCRRRFTESRLLESGLRGFGIISMVNQRPRFLHCQEVAFLQTVPASTTFLPGRPELVLLGQMAAPLQAIWILLPLLRAFAPVGHPLVSQLPETFLCDYVEHLFVSRHDTWCWHDTRMDRHVSLDHADLPQIDHSFLRIGTCQAVELLRAESIFLSWGERVELHDGARRVPDAAFIQSTGYYGPYRLVKKQKCSRDTPHDGLVFILLVYGEHQHFSFLPVGSFLFQALWDNDLSTEISIRDEWGNLVKPDLRLFVNQRFFCTPAVLATRGGGLVSDGLDGLSVAFVASMLSHVVNSFELPFTVHFEQYDTEAGTACSIGLCPLDSNDHDLQLFVILEQSHWSVLAICHNGDSISAMHFDGLANNSVPLASSQILHQHVSVVDSSLCDVSRESYIQQLSQDSCGTVAIAHALILLEVHTDLDSASVDVWHAHLADLSKGFDDCRTGFGPNQSVASELADVLIQHGVPADLAPDRAMQGIRKLGPDAVSKALSGPKPWATLKEIASRPNVSMQWVKADELKAQIDARAASKFKVQPSQKKHKSQPRRGREDPKPLVVDPRMLTLMPSTFEANGRAVAQIAFDEVKTQGTGIAFASAADLAPYLRQGVCISEHALGVLCTSPVPSEQCNGLSSIDLRYPALYSGTGEPILLSGSLLQLGRVKVTRSVDTSFSVDSVKTQTLRISVFKDAWPACWVDFARQPFRCVLHEVPGLQLCREQGCGPTCIKYHCPVDEELDHLVLDLWARAWHSAEGRFVKADVAYFWSALLRIPASASHALQRLSGTKGVFLEPRSASGKEADKDFQVVWLNEVTLEDALHKQRTTPDAIAVVRVAKKFGIRFLSQHFEAGFKALKPTDQYIPVTVAKVWRLFPLPFGTQRSGLQKMLSSLKWEAKVLQQVTSSAAGASWEVGASADPPRSVFQVAGQDVMITFVKEASKNDVVPLMVASTGTRAHLKGTQTSQPSMLDPWMHSDPWSQYRMPAQAASSSSAAPDRVSQLESRMQANIEAAAQRLRAEMTLDSHMDCSSDANEATEARFNRLEVGLTEMKQQTDKLENWVQQVATGCQQTNTAVTQLQQQVGSQQQDFEQFRQEAAQHAQSTAQQFNDIRTDVQSEMQKGFAHIAGLLEKKQRTD